MANWSTKINVRIISANPLIKLLNFILGIIEFFTGIRRTGILSEENNFLIVDTKVKYLWFFLKSEDVLKLGISKISGVKVSTVKSFFIFRSTVVTVYASGINEQVAYQVKVSYQEMKEKAESWLK
jgi:hypothetical protein